MESGVDDSFRLIALQHQKKMGEEERNPKKSFWLPKALGVKDSIYFMSAKHRGDMYHLRAAMQLAGKDYPLVLYEADISADSKTKDVQDYLKHSAKSSFFVPWDHGKISGKVKPKEEDFANCCLNGVEYKDRDNTIELTPDVYGEFASTELIAKAIAEASGRGALDGLLKSIREGMFMLTPETRQYLRGEFDKIFKGEWGISPDDAKKSTILVMDRDTGRSPDGAYPELDTGNGISMIREIVGKIPPRPNGDGELKLTVISCGSASESRGTGIGQYWKKLPTVEQIKNDANERGVVTKRDVEAYFLYWSSQENKEKQYFKMVIGLRSGVIDLCTFMGIPTVSIGLRNMVGEYRHEFLAGKNFKRVNAQYDRPRHTTTAYVKNREGGDPLLASPYWSDDAPGSNTTDFQTDPVKIRDPPTKQLKKKNTKGERTRMKAEQLNVFYSFDEYVVDISVRLACQDYIGWPPSITITTGEFPKVMTTHHARFCNLIEEDGDSRKRREDMDRSSIQAMRNMLHDAKFTLQLSQKLFDRFYLHPSEHDWKIIRSQSSAAEKKGS